MYWDALLWKLPASVGHVTFCKTEHHILSTRIYFILDFRPHLKFTKFSNWTNLGLLNPEPVKHLHPHCPSLSFRRNTFVGETFQHFLKVCPRIIFYRPNFIASNVIKPVYKCPSFDLKLKFFLKKGPAL